MHCRKLAICWLTFASTVMAIETPDHKTVFQDGKYELRDYPEMTVVRTAGGDGDFMRLFRYISGKNTAGEKIAMTAPVLVQHEGEQRGMSFVLPREVAAPAPEAEGVSVERMMAARFAVFTYSGRRTAANEAEGLAKLRTWMKKRDLRAEGDPVFAYYDPPWTLPFFRRNEVMLRLAGDHPALLP